MVVICLRTMGEWAWEQAVQIDDGLPLALPSSSFELGGLPGVCGYPALVGGIHVASFLALCDWV